MLPSIPLDSLRRLSGDPIKKYSALILTVPQGKVSSSSVLQRSQSDAAREVVEEFVQNLPVSNVEEEEEMYSDSLLAKAVECGLQSLLLERGWSCVGESCFVYTTFSTSNERKHILAFTMSVQLDMDGGFIFLVSPDVTRFNRFEVTKLVNIKMLERFDCGEEVDVAFEENNFASCANLPSLLEGRIIGASKVVPPGEDFLMFEEVWSLKHGLQLPNNDYFLKIHLSGGGNANIKWLPSSFVLQGIGLSPAPQSIRTTDSVLALQSFIQNIKAWDFFNGGTLKIMSISSLKIGLEPLTWMKAATRTQSIVTIENFNSKWEGIHNLLLANDFRTPKFTSGDNLISQVCLPAVSGTEKIQTIKIHEVSTPVFEDDATKEANQRHVSVPSHFSNVSRRKEKSNLEELVLSESIGTKGASATDVLVCNKNISKVTKGNEKTEIFDRKCVSEVDKNVSRKQVVNTVNHKMVSTKEEKVNMKPPKRTMKEVKSEDDVQINVTCKRRKLQNDASDIVAKVIDYHARSQLESLTVTELKFFLAFRQAKVGGRKQDLVQRICALL